MEAQEESSVLKTHSLCHVFLSPSLFTKGVYVEIITVFTLEYRNSDTKPGNTHTHTHVCDIYHM